MNKIVFLVWATYKDEGNFENSYWSDNYFSKIYDALVAVCDDVSIAETIKELLITALEVRVQMISLNTLIGNYK